jgi:molybdopterin-guanine dinucleotide biosynthesis protein B
MKPRQAPRAIGFFGDSGSGKTTLIERLVERFARRGLRVAAIKHAHHGFDLDRPGKDSYRFRAAGASQVLIASQQRWALLVEQGDAGDAGDLRRQIARLQPCDLVLVEGFRGQAAIPFIRVWRGPQGTAPAPEPGVAGVVAIASDRALPAEATGGIPCLDLDDAEAVARFVAGVLGLESC